MKNHGECSAETWHAVDRFTMTIGKHENGKLPSIAACHVFFAASELDNPLVSDAMIPSSDHLRRLL